MSRPISEIARDIRQEWPKPYFGAVPYLQAMLAINGVQDDFGADSGKSIVTYFLANAQTFRGPRAKVLKAELKALIK